MKNISLIVAVTKNMVIGKDGKSITKKEEN